MRLVIFLALSIIVSTTAFSATIYVPDNYPTIQDAIDAAVDGDTVIVRAGTYVENIDFLGKAITVKSEQGPAATTIDGNSTNTVVTFQSGETLDSVLDGFTITNGSASHGGGIYCGGYDSSPTIMNNIISFNGKYGIYCSLPESSPEIAHNDVYGNNWNNYSGCVPGEGDISDDPLFIDPVNDDYRLMDSSPCIGAGTLIPGVPNTDIDGNPRPNPSNSYPDIGAHEHPEFLILFYRLMATAGKRLLSVPTILSVS